MLDSDESVPDARACARAACAPSGVCALGMRAWAPLPRPGAPRIAPARLCWVANRLPDQRDVAKEIGNRHIQKGAAAS